MGAPGTATVPRTFARLLQPRPALAVRRHVALRLAAFATGCPERPHCSRLVPSQRWLVHCWT
eukprot:576754-Lingulodinium_polyedra.AAC.1